MKEPWGFITIFTLMMVTIAYLSGCTQFDTKDGVSRVWDVEMVSTDEECRVTIKAQGQDSQEDDSFILDNPKGN